jgi:hypothetical protein
MLDVDELVSWPDIFRVLLDYHLMSLLGRLHAWLMSQEEDLAGLENLGFCVFRGAVGVKPTIVGLGARI